MSRELAKRRLISVVCNERSGGGKAGRALPKVAARLHEAVPDAEMHVVTSTSFEAARDLTRSVAITAQPGDVVAVMGGDGMAHLGVNACAGTDATLAVIPAGTGNDLARGAGIPGSVTEAVEALIRGKSRRIDLSRLTTPSGTCYVGAVVSSGYDARVNRATNDIRLRLGALSYGYIALRELAAFSPLHYRLTIDGVEREVSAMMVAIANTGLFGGGMRIAPDADPADGLLDVTIIHEASRRKLLRLLPSVYTGKFITNPVVERLRAKVVRFDGDDMFVMGDGEELGAVPATVAIEPGVLNLIVG
ncbi:diacylglycerol kinase (ATP) [Tessaracoccus bendigoensis DSM 12906]|uniref:Diacylglycerol kinase (ATP) n=1 Tax=Tessaracoccus bendigoensis DSM 12906 TaxID=1123357 RepID=A0A1M6LKQ2_9ACTN|nr:YegS/Rv2252/BmrU family lipid kinase [Tessaracoccus bendigoensis]SHJ71708.1 diacylglycerol kinase (ATP) [Tessaracoccus bendigoensis DSM 12906]